MIHLILKTGKRWSEEQIQQLLGHADSAMNMGELPNAELEKITNHAYEVAETMMEARRELAADVKITVSKQPE